MSRDTMTTAQQVKDYLGELCATMLNQPALTRGAKGAVVGALNKITGNDVYRYLVLGYLFGFERLVSSKELSEPQWLALHNWIEFWRETDESRWEYGEHFKRECLLVLSEAFREIAHVDREMQRELGIDPLDQLVTAASLGGEIRDSELDDTPPFMVI